MKKIFLALFLALIMASPAFAVGPPGSGSGSGVLTDSNCNQAKYYPYGTLCQDIDDGKLYKGNATGVLEIAAGASGDLLANGTVPLTANWNVGAFTITASGFIGALTGNASTATALAADPANCAAGSIAIGVNASGVAECTATPSVTTITGSLTGNASTASALAADPADCAAGQLATGIAASGALTCTATPALTSIALGADPADAGAIRLSSGDAIVWENATNEVSLTHVANSGLLLNLAYQLQFRDANTYVWSSGAGVIGIAASTRLDINAPDISAQSSITLDDGTGDSPTLTFKDGTDETAAFTKLDAGYLTLTTVAGDGLNILVGNLKVGNGTPNKDNGPDGEDAYIEGKLEVDGVIYADGGVTGNVTGTATGLALSNQAAGDILYFTGTIWERLAKDAGKYLKSGASAVSWDTPPAAGTPTVITVADEAADASSFPLFVTAATGDLGPKTDTAYTYDPTTGTLGATKFSGAFNGTIGATTPAAGTFTSITIAKSSGVAGDLGLYEANSTDTHAAGFRGPASITGDGAYRIQFPNARAAAAGSLLSVTNAGESGTGTAADPYIQTGSWIAMDTDLSSVSASDDTFPSAKATKTALDLKAPIASPTFTGVVTTAGASDCPTIASAAQGTANINIDGASACDYNYSNGESAATYTPVITAPPAANKVRYITMTLGGGAGVVTLTATNITWIGTAGAAATTTNKKSTYVCIIPASGNAQCKIVAEAY